MNKKTHRLNLCVSAFLVVFLYGCGVSRQSTSLPTRPLVIQPSAAEKMPSLKLPEKVKIGIRIGVDEAEIFCKSPIIVKDFEQQTSQEWPAGRYRIAVKGDDLIADGLVRGKKILFSPVGEGVLIEVGTKQYRGAIIIVLSGKKINVINELTIDDYLRGVLPRECGPLWPLESLKAQAVASRTYLVSHLGQHGSQGFDLCSDVHCQVYGGIDKEHPNTNQAVDETRNEIMVYDGKPIKAFFHSNCGGSTENVEYVWQIESQPYLVKRHCRFGTKDPRYHWKKTLANADILKTLKAKTKVTGSELVSIKVHKKSPTSRASKVAVKTNTGTFILSGNEFRIALNPEVIRSMLWTNLRQEKNAYEFEGRGWGHGVGMCQWGARGQADAGRDYRTILELYYPHTEIVVW